jgi:hypothetical protein
MTERERWIVYPLLFLALGASLRDKLGGHTTTKSIVCQELRIVDEPLGNQPPRPLAVLGRAQTNAQGPAIGYLQVNGQVRVDGAITADQFGRNGGGNVPAYQPVPGISVQDFLKALQAAQREARTGSPNEQTPRKLPDDANPPAEQDKSSDEDSPADASEEKPSQE